MNQLTFSPKLTWTSDDWYTIEDNKAAMTRRNEYAKQLKAQGYKVSKFSLPNQLLSFGGIGSNRPHIQVVVNAYGINFSK